LDGNATAAVLDDGRRMTAYLDYAATTPVDARVAARLAECLTVEGNFGNPGSSSHDFGDAASGLVATARAQVAAAVGAEAEEVIWTSGATEANNLALFGVANYYREAGRHIVTVRTEHKAVLDPCRELERQGWRVTYLVPDGGAIDPEQVGAALQPDTVLVSVMHLNNETGVIQDIAAIAAVCARHGKARLHVDAAQSVGKCPLNFAAWGVDLMSLCAHKAYGPKGVGALIVSRKRRVQLQPLQFGGGQERNLRSGTIATHQVVGMGAAFELAAAAQPEEALRLGILRNRLWLGLERLGGVLRNGTAAQSAPQFLNVSFEDVEGESLLAAVRPTIAVSTGSACTSAVGEPSYVLRALGRDERLAESSLRFSLGRFSDDTDIDTAITTVSSAVKWLRRVAGRERLDGVWPDSTIMPTLGRRPPNYNVLTWQHFRRAAQVGVLAGDGVRRGAAGSLAQGAWVQFDVQLAAQPAVHGSTETVAAVRFQSFGCPHVIAIADWLAQMAVGREAAGSLPEAVGALRARFDVPVEKMGRLLLVEDAWRSACSSHARNEGSAAGA
jgi:cysteine desulfurase